MEEIMLSNENKEANHGSDEENWDAVLRHFKTKADLSQLGTYYSYMVNADIKHLSFTLSRYKFASKLLMYKEHTNLLEMGCQEALGALLFQQNINLDRYVGFIRRYSKWLIMKAVQQQIIFKLRQSKNFEI